MKPPVIAIRPAMPDDATAIARIYNQGIVDRIATFETQPRTAADILPWFDDRHPVVVAEMDGKGVAFAATFAYSQRPCYAGVAEYSVYVDRAKRGHGLGRRAMEALIAACPAAGIWKLVSRIFPENTASLKLMKTVGFRQVGIYEKHAQLDGVWRDVVIVERLIET